MSLPWRCDKCTHKRYRKCSKYEPVMSWASGLDQEDSMSLHLAGSSLTRKENRMTFLPKVKGLTEMSWAFYWEDKIKIFELFFPHWANKSHCPVTACQRGSMFSASPLETAVLRHFATGQTPWMTCPSFGYRNLRPINLSTNKYCKRQWN